MARMSTAIHITTRVSVNRVEPVVRIGEWHDDSWRCRVAAYVYRASGLVSRLADRIDRPADHPKETAS